MRFPRLTKERTADRLQREGNFYFIAALMAIIIALMFAVLYLIETLNFVENALHFEEARAAHYEKEAAKCK